MDNKLTTYLAGWIEHSACTSINWRDDFLKSFEDNQNFLIYCPIKYEAIKTGKKAGEHIDYVTGLKKAGHYDTFKNEMRKIWFSDVQPGVNRYEIIKQFQFRHILDGNKQADLPFWGDFEAVARSDFIVVNYKKDIPSWGTPGEVLLAFFLNIPIYVISDVPKTKMNSSLLWWALETSGKVFYNFDDCVGFVKKEYNLK